MKKQPSKFRFKQFAVSHHRSAMKVGVDGVLIGCWADTSDCRSILDVGTGCGLIALIMAQRCREALVVGVDVDRPSVEEALGNVAESPWSDRIKMECCAFPEPFVGKMGKLEKFDLIVSNPPYFNSGVTDAETPREKARHQGELSPSVILEASRRILASDGKVAMVVPTEESEALLRSAGPLGYNLLRKCSVRGHAGAPWKRTLMEWQMRGGMAQEYVCEWLTLEVSPGVPTEEYRALCRDFYLKF